MPKPKITHPFYPIIYVRGYAMTQAEIDATVSTPYMGFNLGATKIRQDWQGKVIRHIFESPLVRLMKDYQYRDIYAEGKEMQGVIPARSIIIHRYYEQFLPREEHILRENYQDLCDIVVAVESRRPDRARELAQNHVRRFNAHMSDLARLSSR